MRDSAPLTITPTSPPAASRSSGLSRVLVIGRDTRQVCEALSRALPRAERVVVEDVFDGIAELHAGSFGAVLADLGPIGDRPAAAAGVLREASGGARLLVFGEPSEEPAARELAGDEGCDHYFVTPADPAELALMLATDDSPPPTMGREKATPVMREVSDDPVAAARSLLTARQVLRAQVEKPGRGLATLLDWLNHAAAPLSFERHEPAPPKDAELVDLRGPLGEGRGVLRLTAPAAAGLDVEPLLAEALPLAADLAQLDDRHHRQQRLAYVDDLTGLYNGRLFRQFLDRTLAKASRNYFPVTLLLFDIDNFKQYNDNFGHGVGDEILKQTASLIRRCCRDHDLVARISGDEFAVVFWEKEGPRQPRDPSDATSSRVPQTPLQIANRFRRLMNDAEFSALGQTGRGKLTISGGMAVYPFDAQTPQALIAAADKALMFNAKQNGKNTIALVQGAKA